MNYTIKYSKYNLRKRGKPTQLWVVRGYVRDESGKLVRWSDMTGACGTNDIDRMFGYYESWNSNPEFNQAQSGKLWRGKVLP